MALMTRKESIIANIIASNLLVAILYVGIMSIGATIELANHLGIKMLNPITVILGFFLAGELLQFTANVNRYQLTYPIACLGVISVGIVPILMIAPILATCLIIKALLP